MTRRPGGRGAVAQGRAKQIAGFLTKAQRALAADDLDAAIAACQEVLVRDPDHWGALSLLDRIKAIFDEREAALLAQRAETCAAEARAHFAEGRHDQAFVLLERFEPPHPIAREALGALRAEAAQLEQLRQEQERLERERQAELDRQREEAERFRLEQEAERLRAEREAERLRLEVEAQRQRLAAEIEAIRSDVRDGELDAALERIGAVEHDEAAMTGLDAAAAELRALRTEVEGAIAEAERREALARAVGEHVARAAGMFARRDYAGALGRLEAALALDPTSAGAIALRARAKEAQQAALQRPIEAREGAKREANQRQAAAREATLPEPAAAVPLPATMRANPVEFPDDSAAPGLFDSEEELAGIPEPPASAAPASRPPFAISPAPVPSPVSAPLPMPAPATAAPRPLVAVPPPPRAEVKRHPRTVASFAPTAKEKAARLSVVAAVIGALVLAGAMWAAFRPDEHPAPGVESAVVPDASVPAPAIPEAALASAPAADGVIAASPQTNPTPVSAPASAPAQVNLAEAPVRSTSPVRVPPPATAPPAPQPRASSPLAPAAPRAPARSETASAVPTPVRNPTVPFSVPVPAAAAARPSGPDAREAAPASGTDSVQDDERAVRATLAAYAAAYSGLDVDGVKRVFPSVNEPALRRAFGSLRSQQVEIQGEQMAVAGDSATVSCTLVASAIRQVGVGAPTRDSRRVVFNLVKRNGSWVIIDRR